MKVLVACEFSQVVCKAFRKRKHEAYSCDILPCEGGHPEWHIQDDVLKHLDDEWDLMIAHPPCIYLCNSGARWWGKRRKEQTLAIKFVVTLMDSKIKKIAIENPIGILSTKVCKPAQIIQPYQFGHPHWKSTCLWLNNLPLLKPTKIVKPEEKLCGGKKPGRISSQLHRLPPSKNRSKLRSLTFHGIADAMAAQWG